MNGLLNRRLIAPLLALAIILSKTHMGASQEKKLSHQALALQAFEVLEKNCASCHGVTRVSGTLDIREPKTLFSQSKNPYIVSGNPENSYLWQRINNGDMPPDRQLTSTDRDLLKAWISEGTPLPPIQREHTQRPYVSIANVLDAIRTHQLDADADDRPFLRYFTFDHLHNDTSIENDRLSRMRAGLSKVLNSMHWKANIVRPRQVDRLGTVFSIDIRDLDWDRKGAEKEDRWNEMMKRYPYGLAHADPNDPKIEKMDNEIFKLAGSLPAIMRADWFVARATRPPLYELVLRLPNTASELENKLGLDVNDNLTRSRAARAGFSKSFVSSQNRLVERHDALYGAYWKSYDFRKGSTKGDLIQFPLGPDPGPGDAAIFKDFAFRHDGGEMIFHLPNGLQAYFLSDGKGKFIDKGPADVVSDPNQRSGTAEIVNGLSCMCCHNKGLIDSVRDDVRKGTAVSGEALTRVRKLYPSRERMQRLIEEDNERYGAALAKAIQPFLADSDRSKPADTVSEPVNEILVKQYNPDVSLNTAALELGVSAEQLKAAIAKSESLRELGLRILTTGGGIKRDLWDNGDRLSFSDPDGHSLFHKTARALGLGNRRVVGR